EGRTHRAYAWHDRELGIRLLEARRVNVRERCENDRPGKATPAGLASAPLFLPGLRPPLLPRHGAVALVAPFVRFLIGSVVGHLIGVRRPLHSRHGPAAREVAQDLDVELPIPLRREIGRTTAIAAARLVEADLVVRVPHAQELNPILLPDEG